jgi:hypothetical protein
VLVMIASAVEAEAIPERGAVLSLYG